MKFVDNATRAIKITPLRQKDVTTTKAMLSRAFSFTPEAVAEMGDETPDQCFDAYFHKDTHDLSQQIKNKNWGESTHNDPASLQYYVARHGDKVVGMCGVYNVLPGYSEGIGALEPCPQLENKKTFWLGWFGVDPEYQRAGIGTKLLEASVKEAVIRSGLSFDECNYAVYADKGASGFYEKMGLKHVTDLDSGHAIVSAPLPQVARRLGINLPSVYTKRWEEGGLLRSEASRA